MKAQGWTTDAPQEVGLYVLRRGTTYWLVSVYWKGAVPYACLYEGGSKARPLEEYLSDSPEWLQL